MRIIVEIKISTYFNTYAAASPPAGGVAAGGVPAAGVPPAAGGAPAAAGSACLK